MCTGVDALVLCSNVLILKECDAMILVAASAVALLFLPFFFFFFSERHQCCVLRFRDFKLVTTEQVDMILTCKESLGVLWFTGEKAALAGTDIFLPIPALLHVSMVVHFFASAQCMLTRETVDLFMFHLIALYFLITPRFFVGD